MKRRLLVAANCAAMVAVMLFATSTAFGFNLAFNPGFEDSETGNAEDAQDWDETVVGPAGDVIRSTAMPNSGFASIYITVDHVNNTEAAGAYFAQQVDPPDGSLDPSENYDLTFFAKVDSDDPANFVGIDMFGEVQWLDQDGSDGGGFQGGESISLRPAGINTGYQQFSIRNMDVPATADSFLLRFQLSAGPIPGIMNGLYVDDVVLDITTGLVGDYNGNGTVDAADYTLWQDTLGATVVAGEGADGNSNGTIDAGDYDVWRTNFGNTSGGSALAPGSAAVPEPSSILIVASCGALLALRRAWR